MHAVRSNCSVQALGLCGLDLPQRLSDMDVQMLKSAMVRSPSGEEK
jgi:hypothetical protein